MPASGAAVAMLGRRSGSIAGTLPRPSLGASTRFASTATAAETSAAGGESNASAAVVVPSVVLVKVGNGIWRPFKHNELLGMDASDLLKALAGSKLFAIALKGIHLGACPIFIVRNAVLPVDVEKPTAEHEMGDAVIEMNCAKTVGDMANEVGVSGAPLFVRVGLPTAAPTFPTLPAPIVFKPITLDGQAWFLTHLVFSAGVFVPVFITAAQHAELERFIREAPSTKPQVFMPVGTIKSGKSTIVKRLLPGMIAKAMAAAGWPSTRLRPVLFQYECPPGCDAEESAKHLQDALVSFGIDITVPFSRGDAQSPVLETLPASIRLFAERVRAGGGELWLLVDELQGPGLQSTPTQAQDFAIMFKKIVEEVSPFGRIVATGSSLLALLNSFRTAQLVNGLALWDAVTFLSVGREPSRAAAQRIAEAIFEPYSTHWPPAAKLAITPTSVIDVLTPPSSHGSLENLPSPRPALVAYILGQMRDGRRGNPDEVFSDAVGWTRAKLFGEPTRDTLSALTAMSLDQRRVLRDVATGGYTVAELAAIRDGRGAVHFKNANVGVQPDRLAALITCLCEEGAGNDVVRLQPPYSTLLGSWTLPNGELAVAVLDERIDLDPDTRNGIIFIADPVQRKVIGSALRRKAGRAFIESLARNCIGVRDADGTVRPPHTAAEFDAVPALLALRGMLTTSFLAGASKREPSLTEMLSKEAYAATQGTIAPASSAAEFPEKIGWELCLAFHYFLAHVWQDTGQLVRSGLTADVIADAVRAAVHVLGHPEHGCFNLEESRLQPKS